MMSEKRIHLWLIQFIGLIVPRRLRADWRQEWEAELHWRESQLAQWDKLDWRNKLDLLWRSLGAFADALALQPRRLEEEMWQDLRFGLRMLGKNWGFTTVAVLTLALGIGANTALFSVIDKLLLQMLPVQDPDALVQLKAESVNPKLTFSDFSWIDYQDLRARNTVLSELTAFKSSKVNFGEGDQLERVRAELVADNYFAMLGVRPLLGRTFTPEENRTPGAHALAVLSYSLWQSRFGGAPDVIGQTAKLNEQPYTIIGVMPARFRGVSIDEPADVWVPAMMLVPVEQKWATQEWLTKHEWGLWNLAGRLKPGVTRAAAEPALDALAVQLRDAWMPESDRHLPFNEKRMQLASIGKGLSSLRNEQGQMLLFIFGMVGVTLLIACANLAGLLLARASARRKEIAVRLALGAGRIRLIRQLLVESFMLAGLGGALGLLAAPWLIEALMGFLGDQVTPFSSAIDWRLAAFALGLSLLTGLLFGMLPAWQATQPDLIPALKDEANAQRDRRGFLWSRRSLLVGQISLSVVVLIAGGLFVRTLRAYLAIDPGFKVQNILTADIQLPEAKYTEAQAAQFFRQLRERWQALPGVQQVAAADSLPLSGAVVLTTVVPESQTLNANEMPTVDMNTVSPGFHELLGVKLEQGRSFSETDRKDQPDVIVINQAFAQKFFPAQDPVGKRVAFGTGKPWLTIIGVTRDIKTLMLDGEPRPQVETVIPHNETMRNQRFLLRTNTDAAALLPQVRRVVTALDPALAFFKATTLEGDLRGHFNAQRTMATLTGLFGVVALLLTAIGLYGAVAYAVNQRTREIGIRLALGAQTADVLRLVLREGFGVIGAGLALGCLAAFAVTRLIEAHLYGVKPHDPLTFVLVGALLFVVALLACWIPARRATKVDPLEALRHE